MAPQYQDDDDDDNYSGGDSIHMQPLGAQNGGGGGGSSSVPAASRSPPSRKPAMSWSGLVDAVKQVSHPSVRQSIAFFLFGLLNNSLYVVILTAALELIPKGTPTGVVAFFNIFPALVAKGVWPYVLRGTVRYSRRVWSCVAMSAVGLLIIALMPRLWTRMAGIALASFSSGLGELTFLQLSTRFSAKGAGRGIGWFASGTGAAGLVGAAAWWVVRPLGVQNGLLSLGFLPVMMGITYAIIMPSVQSVDDAEENAKGGAYAPLGTVDDARRQEDDGESEDGGATPRHSADTLPDTPPVPLMISPHASQAMLDASAKDTRVRLSLSDKMRLIRPMLFVYIVPLVLVYFFEYTINQGVAPTLLYPLPTRDKHPLLSMIIKQLKDYYPFYQLTYQTFVFLSRSSVSIFRLPAIPKRFLWLPAVLQGTLLLVLTTESIYKWFRASIASPLAIVLVCVEGLAGGSAYVSVFYQIGIDGDGETRVSLENGGDDDDDDEGQATRTTPADADDDAAAEVRRAQEHEFRIGCVGVGDSMGILIAALVAMPLELALCRAQVQRGITLCKEV